MERKNSKDTLQIKFTVTMTAVLVLALTVFTVQLYFDSMDAHGKTQAELSALEKQYEQLITLNRTAITNMRDMQTMMDDAAMAAEDDEEEIEG